MHHSGFSREFFEGDPVFELYNMATDPFEQNDVAEENPQIVAEMTVAYDSWFDDVAGRYENIDAPLSISVGTQHETTTVLTRNDWTATSGGGWGNPEANGKWTLQVETGGEYDINLLFPNSIVAKKCSGPNWASSRVT